jgi:hypothetical protein
MKLKQDKKLIKNILNDEKIKIYYSYILLFIYLTFFYNYLHKIYTCVDYLQNNFYFFL